MVTREMNSTNFHLKVENEKLQHPQSKPLENLVFTEKWCFGRKTGGERIKNDTLRFVFSRF